MTARCAAACAGCYRRSLLLAELGGVLDRRAGDPGGLLAVLACDEEPLIDALGGRRKAELRASLGSRGSTRRRALAPAPAVCRHHQHFPGRLQGPAAAHLLYVAGPAGCLDRVSTAPAVALLGARRPSEYGIEMAYALARALAASGACVVSLPGDGIARAAREGARCEDRAGVLVCSDALPPTAGSSAAELQAQIARGGCAVSELPPGCPGRRWGPLAAERTAVELADLVIVVEAEPTPTQLFGAGHARASGRVLAAIPGRSTFHLAQGPLALLREGAKLVRGPEDALELLDLEGDPRGRSNGWQAAGLAAPLRLVLEQVAAGRDTPEQLLGALGDAGALFTALSELELMGRVRRGRGGRYVVCA